jgi:hypothetical protein
VQEQPRDRAGHGSGPGRLPAEQILHLQALGARVRHAGSPVERELAVHDALDAAWRLRDAGIAWTGLSGVTRDQRDHPAPPAPAGAHRQAATARPGPPQILPTADTGPGGDPRAGLDCAGHTAADRYAHGHTSSTGSILAHSLSSAGQSALSGTTSGRSRLAVPRRAVLVLTADPRPGPNTFDPEVENMRRWLDVASVDLRHLAMVGLGEVARAVDREQPAIVHVSAHRGLGGLALTMNGNAHFVDPGELAAALERAQHRPRCTVLGFCASDDVAGRLTRSTPSVISWPGPVDDRQSACFTGELYRQVAAGDPLPRCVEEASHTARSHWPSLDPPILHGRWRDPVL